MRTDRALLTSVLLLMLLYCTHCCPSSSNHPLPPPALLLRYDPIMALLSRLDGRLSFTCVEMRDCEHPPEGRCSPQALLQHIIESAEAYGVPLAGENALQR